MYKKQFYLMKIFFFKLDIENIKILNEYSNEKSTVLKFSSELTNLNEYNSNVYDFSNWSKIHPGGMLNIEKFANDDNNFTLIYPSWHSTDRFIDNLNNYLYIGKYNNLINYKNLNIKFKNNYIKQNLKIYIL